MLRYLTSGNSHGDKIMGILDGFPAGIKVSQMYIENQLKRRRSQLGRSARQGIERDDFDIVGGVDLKQRTTGSPIGIIIANRKTSVQKDYQIPRPGHADLSGMIKYSLNNVDSVRERASARETCVKTALFCFCARLLEECQIKIKSSVLSLGGERVKSGKLALEKIRKARERRISLGGIFEIRISNMPIGLGSYAQSDRRLSALIAAQLASLNGIKGLESGEGFGFAKMEKGVDELVLEKGRIWRKTNFAGGIEGGVSNGEDIILRCVAKPVSGSAKGVSSVDLGEGVNKTSVSKTSDITSVFACAVVAEFMAAYAVSNALLEKFGGDSLSEIKERISSWRKACGARMNFKR